MKKIFITGGSGTVGQAFIEQYCSHYKIFCYSRNEKMQVALKRKYPDVEVILGAVEDGIALKTSVRKVAPDIIIHAAAMKHIDSAEISPITAVKSNIIGSLNLIEAAVDCAVPVTVAISTDKACRADSNYGHTKSLMEKMFLESHTCNTKFAVCRFGNVSHSHGSVIPYWLTLKADGKALPLTHKEMNRLMFSRSEAGTLVHDAISRLSQDEDTFILSKKMKSVNMFELAKVISDDISIIGLRPGEKLNETLVSNKECEFTFVEGDDIVIREYINKGPNRLAEEYSSASAEFMTEDELRSMLDDADEKLHESMLDSKLY